MQKRNILNSPRLLELKKRRRKVFFNKIILIFFVTVFIFASLSFLSRLKQHNIAQIEITGNKLIDTHTISTLVEKEIQGNYLWIFPKTNTFLYPKTSIREKLSNEFKRLKNVTFTINEQVLEIGVSERSAVYTWCDDAISLASNDNQKCYFMDEAGYIFDEAPYFSGEVYFKFYGSANMGTYFSKENFKQLIDFKNTLISMGLKPVSMHILADGDIKIYLSTLNKTSVGPYLVFKANSDFQKIAENLDTALNTEPLQSSFKNKYSSLVYIDLRFGNKVLYKFR